MEGRQLLMLLPGLVLDMCPDPCTPPPLPEPLQVLQLLVAPQTGWLGVVQTTRVLEQPRLLDGGGGGGGAPGPSKQLRGSQQQQQRPGSSGEVDPNLAERCVGTEGGGAACGGG